MKIKYPKTTNVEFTISDFAEGIDTTTDENNTSFDKSVNSYNFEYKNGALTESVGFKKLSIPSYEGEGSAETTAVYRNSESDGTFNKVALYKEFNPVTKKREDKIFYVSNDCKVYYGFAITRTPLFVKLDELDLTEIPRMKSYNDGDWDCIVFFNDEDAIFTWDNNIDPKTYEDVPRIYDFCTYNDRVCAILSGDRLKIRTDTVNLLDWESADTQSTKYVYLDQERGYANKLLTFNGYMFVVRDFGISKIYLYDDGANNLSHILSTGSRIYANTACICSNRGIVLGKDGLYEFDSVSAKKLDVRLNRMLSGVSNQYAVGAFKDGIYYLACKLNFDDGEIIGCENGEYKNNALILFDTETDNYSICRGIDIVDLYTIQHASCDKLLACFNGSTAGIAELTKNGKVFDAVQTKYWRSPLTDLGYSDKIKFVKELSLLSLYDITIKVFSESEEREFNIKGGNIISRIPVRVKGKRIGISIKSETEKAYVSNFKLTCNLVDNEYV